MNENNIENLGDFKKDNIFNEERKDMLSPKKPVFLILVVLIIGLGIFTGYKLSRRGGEALIGGEIPKGQIVKGKEFGAKDASSFKDTAMGVLEKNTANEEGTHRLIREGGPSQTVFLTSSVLDLDQFVGIKIQIWGETFKSQKAGWLMDVGRIKILE